MLRRLGEDEFALGVAFEQLNLSVRRFGLPAAQQEPALGRSAAFALATSLEHGGQQAARALLELDQALFGSTALVHEFDPPVRAIQGALERIVREIEFGRIVVSRESIQPLSERTFDGDLELPPLAPPSEESAITFFEVRLLDEIGQAIGRVALDFEAARDVRDVITNAGGVALIEGVESFHANIAVPDLDALEQVLDPRWETIRSGRFPKESNQTGFVLDGSPIGSVALRAAVPNMLVIQPIFGNLLLELADKRSRVRHKQRPYKLTGPVELSGETDERGLVSHPRVPNGDYRLELDVEIDVGESAPKHETLVTPAVVLAATDTTPQFRGLGALPEALLLRLKGLVFDTNKAFLLPSALPSFAQLRRVLLAHSPGKLLIVGHTDTTAEPSYNEKLSLTRAQATAAFLEDDVKKWLEFYESKVPGEQRWGAHEDAQMLLSLPDFERKPAREDPIRWFQRTRLLQIDGVAGRETRTQLVKEYMMLDGVSLSEDPELDLAITCHGCGENFPLDESGDGLDQAPEDDKEDQLDRRVELYLFDPEFGIQPPPPGEISKAGSSAYPAWRKRAELGLDLEAAGRRVTIRILDDADTPQTGAEYRVRIGREVHLGTATDGVVDIVTAADGSRCVLEWTPSGGDPLPIAGGNPTHASEVFVVPVGAADPETAGRLLQNLGYSSSFGLSSAVLAFQSDQGLDETGELDDPTTFRLDQLYAELAEA
ncbi:MAG: hypothetical protein QM756_03275 [Polyangiaceae bacterium]